MRAYTALARLGGEGLRCVSFSSLSLPPAPACRLDAALNAPPAPRAHATERAPTRHFPRHTLAHAPSPLPPNPPSRPVQPSHDLRPCSLPCLPPMFPSHVASHAGRRCCPGARAGGQDRHRGVAAGGAHRAGRGAVRRTAQQGTARHSTARLGVGRAPPRRRCWTSSQRWEGRREAHSTARRGVGQGAVKCCAARRGAGMGAVRRSTAWGWETQRSVAPTFGFKVSGHWPVVQGPGGLEAGSDPACWLGQAPPRRCSCGAGVCIFTRI